MSSHHIPLEMIPQGWYMSWFMSTQAAYNICVTLKDSAGTYVNNACRQSTQFGVLSEGFAQVAGTGMGIDVNISQSDNVLVVNHPVVVPNIQGVIVAQGYVLCFEDAGDQDFNDLYVSITAWKNKG